MPERRLDPVLHEIAVLKEYLQGVTIADTSPNYVKRQRALAVLESVETILRMTCESMEVGVVGYYGFDFNDGGSSA